MRAAHQPLGSHSSAEMHAASRTIAVARRTVNMGRGGDARRAVSVCGLGAADARRLARTLGQLLAGAAVAALALLVGHDGAVERRAVEIGPEGRGEIELGV